MANWTMGLESSPMNRMKSGLKKVEFRLDKPKWKDLAVGDTIEFHEEPGHQRKLRVRVLEVIRCSTFRELLEYCNQLGCLEPGRNLEEQVRRLDERYPKEEWMLYGNVLGIRLEVVNE